MNRLHIKRLRSIGAVEAGDNPEADIMLWKSKPTEPDQGQTHTKAGDTVSKIDLSALDPEVRSHIEDLEAKLGEREAEVPPLPDDLPDIVKTRLEAQDEALAKERDRNEALASDVAKMREERAVETYTKLATDLSPMLGDPEKSMPILKAIGEAAPEPAAELSEILKAFAFKTEFAGLLKEYGSTDPEGSALDKIDAYAAEIKKSNPELTLASARVQAWQDHPELKDQAREEGVR